MRVRRLPFEPLTELMGTVLYERCLRTYDDMENEKRWEPIPGAPITVLSELTGINRRTMVRWTTKGIPEEQADRIACALGLHVALIWPSWFDPETMLHDYETVQT